MDRLGVRQVLEGNGKQKKEKMEKTNYEVICGAQTTLAVTEEVRVKVNSTHE